MRRPGDAVHVLHAALFVNAQAVAKGARFGGIIRASGHGQFLRLAVHRKFNLYVSSSSSSSSRDVIPHLHFYDVLLLLPFLLVVRRLCGAMVADAPHYE